MTARVLRSLRSATEIRSRAGGQIADYKRQLAAASGIRGRALILRSGAGHASGIMCATLLIPVTGPSRMGLGLAGVIAAARVVD